MDEARTATLDELEAWIGREHSFVGVDAVSRNDIRRKLEVFCFDCPLHYDDAVARAHGYRELVAPVAMTALWAMPPYWVPGEPVFYAPSEREKPGGIRIDLPTVYPRGVNTATEWDFFEPLYAGDTLKGDWRLVELKRRETKLGNGVFITVETSIYKQTGELVAKNRNTGFRYTERSGDGGERKPREPKPDFKAPSLDDVTLDPGDWKRQLRFADVAVGGAVPPYSMWLSYQRIVMSVAVDRMWSGIHHNRERAQSAGFKDIIFNTRSYEMLFEAMLQRWIGLSGRIRKLGPFRMTGSSYPEDVITAQAWVIGKSEAPGENLVKLELLVLNPRGEAARGEAQVFVPA